MVNSKSIYNQIISGGVIAILLFIPLFPKLPLFFVPRASVAVRVEDFIIAVFALLSLPLFWQRRKEFLRDNLVLALLGFLAIGLFSTFSAIFVTQSVYPHLAILHFVRRIEYILPFFIVYALLPDLGQLRKYFKVIIFTSLLVFAYGVGQIYLSFPVFSTTNIEYAKGIPLKLGPEARVNSTFAGHYDLAAYLAMILSFSGALLVGVSFGVKKIPARIFILLTALFNLWLLLQTASRVSFIAYLAGISVALLLLNKRLFLVLVLLVSLLSLLSSNELRVRFLNTLKYGTKTLNYQIIPKSVWAAREATKSAPTTTSEPTQSYTDIVPGEPTNTQQLGVFRSSRVRFDFEWPKAWGAFLRNPVLGSGYSSLGLATDNDYLRSLGEVGLLGTFAFGLIFLEIFKRIIAFLKRFKEITFEKTIVAGLAGVIVALLVNATFIDVFEASKVAILFWTFIGILAVTIKISSQGKVTQGESF